MICGPYCRAPTGSSSDWAEQTCRQRLQRRSSQIKTDFTGVGMVTDSRKRRTRWVSPPSSPPGIHSLFVLSPVTLVFTSVPQLTAPSPWTAAGDLRPLPPSRPVRSACWISPHITSVIFPFEDDTKVGVSRVHIFIIFSRISEFKNDFYPVATLRIADLFG